MDKFPKVLMLPAALMWSAAALGGAVPDTPDTPFKLATFEAKGRTSLGMVLEDRIVLELAPANAYVTREAKLPAVQIPTAMRELIEQYEKVNRRLYQIANYFQANPPSRPPFVFSAAEVSFKAPIKYPWNILAIAANYRAHAEGVAAQRTASEAAPGRKGAGAAQGGAAASGFNASVLSQIDPDRDAPVFFAKSPRSCIIDPGDSYYIPPGRERIDWEGELAIVIGKPTRFVSKEQSHDYVFGYSIMYDLSDRGGGAPRRTVSMFSGTNWFEGKSIDRGAPFGPVIVPKEFIADAGNLRLVTRVNGEVMQSDRTESMIWKERHMISYLSSILTLYPGDVISTGTPAGTGMERQKFLKPGDVVSIEIEKIGTLTTNIRAWSDQPSGGLAR